MVPGGGNLQEGSVKLKLIMERFSYARQQMQDKIIYENYFKVLVLHHPNTQIPNSQDESK